ncbi:hypothetical protein SARC_08870 [Sphaeroforma arctica JP610]|uniref:CUB domain-containing protein n=1 Tax=Sphaeroforma arctica JP610 TaxID=667725 RepID=A0A0L0FQA7_9EUKA|nr:hypothetical protein SARC_08870 [Sphaeroforma arctica JP610]KNC78716.1 hypothetical protein SARC_08870 [Sphaeroforma arctica JP610]|eukprot:XP_014152618.1 hypothetical protein SARC_08870 [Sphaeroforma arctica JP610]
MFGYYNIVTLFGCLAQLAGITLGVSTGNDGDSKCNKADFKPEGIYDCTRQIMIHDTDSDTLHIYTDEEILIANPEHADKKFEIRRINNDAGNAGVSLLYDVDGVDPTVCLMSNFPSDTANRAFCVNYTAASTWNLEWSNECEPNMMYIQGSEPVTSIISSDHGGAGFPFVTTLECTREENSD